MITTSSSDTSINYLNFFNDSKISYCSIVRNNNNNNNKNKKIVATSVKKTFVVTRNLKPPTTTTTRIRWKLNQKKTK